MKIEMPTKIKVVETGQLVPSARNARTHTPEQVGQIMASIKEFGFTNPVLISPKLDIIAGHGRVMAAEKLGMEVVPCIVLDGLTETQRRAYMLADNKLALNSGWDDGLLRQELEALEAEMFDVSLLGFSQEEIERTLVQFFANESEMPNLDDGDKQPFQQKTFTLHDEQVEEVDGAIHKAKSLGHGESAVNENSNGNALAFICQSFNRANP